MYKFLNNFIFNTLDHLYVWGHFQIGCCIYFWGRLHWVCLHFSFCPHLGCLCFNVILTFKVTFIYGIVFIVEVIFNFWTIFIFEVVFIFDNVCVDFPVLTFITKINTTQKMPKAHFRSQGGGGGSGLDLLIGYLNSPSNNEEKKVNSTREEYKTKTLIPPPMQPKKWITKNEKQKWKTKNEKWKMKNEKC